MTDSVERMLAQVGSNKRPPIDKWDPPLSGTIDIHIDSEGNWFHEGDPIARHALVKLFASILRHEPENGFVLVTPVEKWQIRVDDAPFIAVAMAQRTIDGRDALVFVTNVGEEVVAGGEHPLLFDSAAVDAKPYIQLRPGVLAKLSRPVYYQLVDDAVVAQGKHGIWSCGEFFVLAEA